MIKILAYSIEQEPITQVLLKYQEELDLISLCVNDLLHLDTEIFDTFDESETKIYWKIPDIGAIENTAETFLLNRVCNLPTEWFDLFEKEDRSYAQNEFWAYLMFALNAFPHASEYPGPGALFGSSHSLTAQWDIIDELKLPVKTPEFFFGPESRLPAKWRKRTIFSEPYSFYSWKANACPLEKKNNVFGIKKPRGFPVVVFCIGDEILIFSQNGDKLTNPQEESLTGIAKKIFGHFGFFCMEALFFVGKDEIVFGMCNNTPWASQRAPDFEEVLLKEVQKELKVVVPL